MATTKEEPKAASKPAIDLPKASDVPNDPSQWEPLVSKPKEPPKLNSYKVVTVGGKFAPAIIKAQCSSYALREYVRRNNCVPHHYRFRAKQVQA